MANEKAFLPSGWVETTLIGVALKIISGSGFPKKYQGQVQGEYPFAKVGDISQRYRAREKYICTANHYISKEVKEEIKGRIFPENSIVFPKIGEALKNNYRLVCKRDMLFDNNVMGVVPEPKNVSSTFVYYFLETQDFGEFAVATAVPSIRRSDVENIRLLLPPLNEQHRIVAKIEELFSEIDKGVESLETAKAQLQVYRQALLKHAFEGKLTAQWRADNPDKVVPAEQLLEQIKQAREERYQQQLADWQTAVEKWEVGGKKGKKPSKPKLVSPKLKANQTWMKRNSVPATWAWSTFENLLEYVTSGSRGWAEY